jgi:phenylpropionate dioxygenase-like ring-hydroxylating dioxygenase large terminal subunit
MQAQDNERLVRVGPGTPAGNLFRRYWQPALLSSELPEKDGAPVRLRLLSEDLLAYRDSNGDVGIVDAFCPHRRAPLFFGRNEECGLRCVYHGWKFDKNGDCVDMPSEPVGTPLQARVKIKAYPAIEKAGLVWVYMGPLEAMPPAPDYEWLRAPQSHRFVSKTLENCNYLQALEGGLDTAHVSFLHRDTTDHSMSLAAADGAPRLDVEVTDYGYNYVSTRNIGADQRYVRLYQYIMPAQQMRSNVLGHTGKRPKVPKIDGHIWMPIDDHTTWVYNFMYSYDASVELDEAYAMDYETRSGRGPDHLIPGTFALKQNASNDYEVDRDLQKRGVFSGIRGVNTQDFALQEGMGAIVDRTKEFLGSTDKAIVTMRRLLLEATRQVEDGEAPRGLDPQKHGNIRAHDDLLPQAVDWRERFAQDALARW